MKKLYAASIGLVLLTSCGKVDLSKNVFETSTSAPAAVSSDAAQTTAETQTNTVPSEVPSGFMYETVGTSYGSNGTDSVKMPELVFIKRVSANEYCSDKTSVSVIDRKGKRYYTEDKNICALNNEDIGEKLAAGALDAYLTKTGYADTKELAENYKLVCEALENDDCTFKEPEMLPDVEAPVISVSCMYYNTDGELKSVRIYQNECMTSIFTSSNKLTKVYKWYSELNKN